MACRNTPCKYHDDARGNGCKLFPGASWTNCRRAQIATRKQPTATKKTKGK